MKKETDRMERPNLSGKVIPAHFVRSGAAHQEKSATPPAPTVRASVGDKPNEPKIVLHKEGQTVKAIEVQCTCGALIRLDCEY